MGNLHSSWAITRKKDNKKEQENKKIIEIVKKSVSK